MSVNFIQIVKHVVFFCVVFGLVFLGAIEFLVTEKKEVAVPELVGGVWSEVQKEARALGLKAKKKEMKPHFFSSPHTVLTQSISSGEIVPEGREIYFDISSGRDPDWKNKVIGQQEQDLSKYLKEQNITFVSMYHLCSDAPSGAVVDAQWDSDSKKMNVLVEDVICKSAWILKDLQKSQYVSKFQQELRSKGMQVRWVGNAEGNFKVVTDPPPGSIVRASDFVIIRKE